MRKALLVSAAFLLLTAQAEARTSRHIYRVQHFREAMAMVPSSERVVAGRPAGCPNAFCGCEASLYKFGRIIPGLNLAANWRRFPHAAPAPGMAAVRSGHVMILESQVSGNVWTVHDGNSGGHVTREHPRSLAGYTIVDPNGTTGTFAYSNTGVGNSGYGNPGYANATTTRARFANARYANAGFSNTGFSNNWQGSYQQASYQEAAYHGSYRHAWRSRRMARAYGAYAMMR
jgi:hypothetical protein